METRRLKRQVLLGSIWGLLGGGGQRIVSLVLFVYLARLLTPADIGLVALAMVVIDIMAFASRFGQVELLQQRSDLDEEALSASFWMLTGLGLFATAAVAAGAAIFGAVAPATPLTAILLWLSPLCVLQTLAGFPEALMKRRLDFRTLAVRSWVATAAGGIVAVILVHFEYGVYALVGQRLAAAFVQVLLLWFLLDWRPASPFDIRKTLLLARTGAPIMLAGGAGTLNARIADGIVGIALGASQLGFLRLGWQCFDFTVQFAVAPISSVALSSFSRMQHDLPMLRRAYLRLTQFMAVGSLPVFFGLGAIADVWVPLVLGSQWSGSVGVLQLLGFAMLPGTVNYFFGAALIAVGKPGVVLRQSVAQVFLTVLLVSIGAWFGLMGAVVAIVARAALVSVYNLHALRSEVGLHPLSVLRMLVPPAVAAAVMAGGLWSAKIALAPTLSDPVLLPVLIGIGVALYGSVFLAGDSLGMWSGYIRGAADSLLGTVSRERAGTAVRPRPAGSVIR